MGQWQGWMLPGLVLLATLPLLSMLSITLYSLWEEVYQDTRTQLQNAAALKTQQVQQWVSQGRQVATLMAYSPELRALAPFPQDIPARQAASQGLRQVVTALDGLRSLSVLDPRSGEVMLSSDTALLARVWRDEPSFRQGRQQVFVGPMGYSLGRESSILLIGAPLQSLQDSLLGVVVVELDLQHLATVIRQRIGLGQGGRAYLVDAYGFYITTPVDNGEPVRSHIARNPAVTRLLARQDGQEPYRRDDGVRVLGLYRWLGETQMGLVVEMPLRQHGERIARVAGQIIITAVVMATLMALLAFKLRQAYQRLHYLVSHDTLTGLISRAEFERRLKQAHHRFQREGHDYVLGVLDLDHFKQINDTAGHAAGDALLAQVAQTLRGCIRSRDTLARQGGDEFAMLLEHCDLCNGEGVAQAMVQALEALRLDHQGRQLRIGVSIGLSTPQAHDPDEDAVLQRADEACYQAKHGGRGQVVVSARVLESAISSHSTS